MYQNRAINARNAILLNIAPVGLNFLLKYCKVRKLREMNRRA